MGVKIFASYVNFYLTLTSVWFIMKPSSGQIDQQISNRRYEYERWCEQMKGRVIEVLQNQTLEKSGGGTYKATLLKMMTDAQGGRYPKPSEEKVHRIFPNHPVHATVLQLKPGDHIDVRMKKEGKFWNIEAINLIEQSQPGKPQSGNATHQGTYQGSSQDPEVASRIARSVAVDKGAGLVTAMLSAGLFGKKVTQDVLVDSALTIANRLTPYILGEVDMGQMPGLEVPPPDYEGSEGEGLPDHPQ